MTIIDLYGIPGSGKSTFAANLYGELCASKKKVLLYNKNDYIVEGIYNKKIQDYIRLILPKNILYYFKIAKPLNIKKNSKSLKETVWRKLRLVMLHDLLNRKMNVDYIIIDQGIIQDFTELTHGRKIGTKYIENYITSFKNQINKIMYVYCNISVDNAINRINNRKREKFLFDQLSNDELRQYLICNLEEIKEINKK